jgi:hypothetical protein
MPDARPVVNSMRRDKWGWFNWGASFIEVLPEAN